jgi:hypothetical protein
MFNLVHFLRLHVTVTLALILLVTTCSQVLAYFSITLTDSYYTVFNFLTSLYREWFTGRGHYRPHLAVVTLECHLMTH